jgi:protease PrsW
MVINPLIFGIIPSLVWLTFFLFEDHKRPEPRSLIFYVFLAGGLSTAVAALPELYIQRIFSLGETFLSSVSLLLSFAFVEEFAKFLAVYLIVSKNKYFDEWVDGMVYMVTAGLGFAALENILNLIGTDLIVEVTLIRGIGATLLHALASAIVGFYWMRKRLIEGLFFATVLHAIFNYLILLLNGVEVYASLLLLLAAVIVFHDFEILKRRDAKEIKKGKRLTLRRGGH